MFISKLDLEIAKEFAQQFNVSVRYINSVGGGYADSKGRRIHIYIKRGSGIIKHKSQFYSNLCHEICHILCYDHKKYYTYHYETSFKNKDFSISILRRTGLKAERYVEKMAGRMYNSLFPNKEYRAVYIGKHAKWAKKWFYKNYLDYHFPKAIK